MVGLTKLKFLKPIKLVVPPSTTFKNPSNSNVFKALYKIGYQAKVKGISEFQ